MSATFRLALRPFGIARLEKERKKIEKKKKADTHELTSRLKFVAYVQEILATFAPMYCRQQ